MVEETNVKEKLDIITDLLQESSKKKDKKFRLPLKGKVNPRNASKGYVTIIKVNENGFIDITKVQIEDQTTMIDGIPRLATPDYVLHWKKNPIIIQPSWSVKPFSPSEQSEKAMNDGSNTKGYKLLMSRMKTELTAKKLQMGGWIKWIIGAALLGVIAYAFLTGGGA